MTAACDSALAVGGKALPVGGGALAIGGDALAVGGDALAVGGDALLLGTRGYRRSVVESWGKGGGDAGGGDAGGGDAGGGDAVWAGGAVLGGSGKVAVDCAAAMRPQATSSAATRNAPTLLPRNTPKSRRDMQLEM